MTISRPPASRRFSPVPTPFPSSPTAWACDSPGPQIEHGAKGYNIVSDGIPSGAIQVPGNGLPLILLADRQTTGGYPKIATVISWDLPRLAQSPPGTELRFQSVDRAEAVRIAKASDQAFRDLIATVRPAGLSGLGSSDLLAVNLVGGVVDAQD